MTIVLLYGDMQRRLKTLVKELSRREPEIHDFVWDLTRALRAKSNDIEYHRKEAFARKHSPVPLSELLGKVSDGRQGVFSRDLCIEQLRRLLEDAELWTRTQSHPEPIFYPEFTVEDGVSCACHILYQNQGFEVKGNYSPDEQRLLFLEHIDLKRRKFERLRNKFDNEAASDVEYRRVAIPESVRIAVWRRDDGKCAKCGSRANLEYDHIVPVSKGGSNTVRNIELLCEPCNRSKSAHIG